MDKLKQNDIEFKTNNKVLIFKVLFHNDMSNLLQKDNISIYFGEERNGGGYRLYFKKGLVNKEYIIPSEDIMYYMLDENDYSKEKRKKICSDLYLFIIDKF
jgi:hypothetical protein